MGDTILHSPTNMSTISIACTYYTARFKVNVTELMVSEWGGPCALTMLRMKVHNSSPPTNCILDPFLSSTRVLFQFWCVLWLILLQ